MGVEQRCPPSPKLFLHPRLQPASAVFFSGEIDWHLNGSAQDYCAVSKTPSESCLNTLLCKYLCLKQKNSVKMHLVFVCFPGLPTVGFQGWTRTKRSWRRIVRKCFSISASRSGKWSLGIQNKVCTSSTQKRPPKFTRHSVIRLIHLALQYQGSIMPAQANYTPLSGSH